MLCQRSYQQRSNPKSAPRTTAELRCRAAVPSPRGKCPRESDSDAERQGRSRAAPGTDGQTPRRCNNGLSRTTGQRGGTRDQQSHKHPNRPLSKRTKVLQKRSGVDKASPCRGTRCWARWRNCSDTEVAKRLTQAVNQVSSSLLLLLHRLGGKKG